MIVKHVKHVTKTRRPAMALDAGECLKGFLEGEFPLCCGFPSLVDCVLSGVEKGDAA